MLRSEVEVVHAVAVDQDSAALPGIVSKMHRRYFQRSADANQTSHTSVDVLFDRVVEIRDGKGSLKKISGFIKFASF